MREGRKYTGKVVITLPQNRNFRKFQGGGGGEREGEAEAVVVVVVVVVIVVII
jgi:hypothetical protein